MVREIREGFGFFSFVGLAFLFFSLFFVVGWTVSHRAEEIRPGVFGLNYAGNWSFVNGSVSIGSTDHNGLFSVEGAVGLSSTNKSITNSSGYGKLYYRNSSSGYSEGLYFMDELGNEVMIG